MYFRIQPMCGSVLATVAIHVNHVLFTSEAAQGVAPKGVDREHHQVKIIALLVKRITQRRLFCCLFFRHSQSDLS
jgi:hypothetical protein